MKEVLKLNQTKYGHCKSCENTGIITNATGTFNSGRIYAVLGPSMTDKSILLSLMAGLVQPESGEIMFAGCNIAAEGAKLLHEGKIGLLLQEYKLLPYLTAIDNIMLQLEVRGMPPAARKKAAFDLLDRVAFDKSRYGVKASGLSCCEQQKVMLSRAICSKPQLLLIETEECYETPELESVLMTLIDEAAHKEGSCVIITTDSKGIADRAEEVWGLKSGILLPVKSGDSN